MGYPTQKLSGTQDEIIAALKEVPVYIIHLPNYSDNTVIYQTTAIIL